MTSAGARSRLRSQPRRANGLAAASRLASFSDGVRNDLGAGPLKVGGLGRTLDHRADFGACLEERLDDEASVGASRTRYEDHGLPPLRLSAGDRTAGAGRSSLRDLPGLRPKR